MNGHPSGTPGPRDQHYSYAHYANRDVAEGFDALRFSGPIGRFLLEDQERLLLESLSPVAGRVIADLYAGDHDAWRGFPFFQRRMPLIPPEPFRWIGYQAYTRLTGRSPRR